MIHRLYERQLRRCITSVPGHLCIILSEEELRQAPDQLMRVTEWCAELAIPQVTFHVSTDDPAHLRGLVDRVRSVASMARLRIFCGRELWYEGGAGITVDVAVGTSGREEITRAIRRMAREGVFPDEVTEEMIEEHLTFPYEPDLVMKTGGSYLTDFLIWQSVYAELLFLDINWPLLRKVDFLRAIRDYQDRSRRFGR